MRTASPLRYPGGKSALAGLLRETRRLNCLGGRALAEPFAGGAGASLSLLFQEETPEAYLNDADPAISDFWWALLNRTDTFLQRILETQLTIVEWKVQRDTYRGLRDSSRLDRGFATFYLNRCNRSGIIINGGPIGGIEQSGKWKLDARFNRRNLWRRCERVADYRDRVHVSSLDALDFLASRDDSRSFYFIDPPYFSQHETLYQDNLDAEYHTALANQLRSMSDAAWVVTYDECSDVLDLYSGWANIRPFSLRYVAAERRHGSELFITPAWMEVPRSQPSKAIKW